MTASEQHLLTTLAATRAELDLVKRRLDEQGRILAALLKHPQPQSELYREVYSYDGHD